MHTRPQRLQRKRTPGWQMPPDAVYVGRPTPWGNPWIHGTRGKVRLGWPHDIDGELGRPLTAAQATGYYRRLLLTDLEPDPWQLPVTFNAQQMAEARLWLRTRRLSVLHYVRDLRGRTLVCWCPPGCPCHADVLLELANG